MKTILMTCLLALCAACSGDSNNDLATSCHFATYNLAHNPQLFLICEGDIVAECFTEPVSTGFQWDGYYCRNDDPSR